MGELARLLSKPACTCVHCQVLSGLHLQQWVERYRRGERRGWDDDLSEHALEVLARAGHDAASVQQVVESFCGLVELLVRDANLCVQPGEREGQPGQVLQ